MWHVFEKLLESVANYSSFIGKVWITMLFMFRLIMVASIGDTVYSDEQSAFKCNTLQPGCENICYNKFSPISQIRFWAVNILFVGTPSIIFIVYAMHTITTMQQPSHQSKQNNTTAICDVKNNRTNSNNKKCEEVLSHLSGLDYNESWAASKRNELKKIIEEESNKKEKKKKEMKVKKIYQHDGVSEVITTTNIARAYFVQAVLRTAVEGGFLYLQYNLFGFHVTDLYLCEGSPCPRVVECFVSRPMEKTIFLRFMYAMTILSLILNIMELYVLVSNWANRTCCSSNKNGSTTLEDKLPMKEIILHRSRHRGRTIIPNTFPELGPFPRSHDNSFGKSSGDDTMDSDYRFYV